MRSSSRTCRCSTPAPAARPPPSSSAASATCSSPGRTRPFSRSRSSARTSSRSSSPRQHPRRAAGGGGRQGRRQARDPRGRRGLPRVPLHPRGAGDRRATSTGPAVAAAARSTQHSSPRSGSSPSTRSSAAGRRRSRSTSPTAACSTRSTSRAGSRCGSMRVRRSPFCPASASLGYTLHVPGVLWCSFRSPRSSLRSAHSIGGRFGAWPRPTRGPSPRIA